MTQQLLTASQFADKARTKVLASLEPNDQVLYKIMCEEYRIANGLPTGFDFFTYAAHLAPSVAVWKPFLTKLRALGRYQLIMPRTEDEKARKQHMEDTINRATLMAHTVTPMIANFMFCGTMRRAIPDQDTCVKLCTGVMQSILKEESATKSNEMSVALANAVDTLNKAKETEVAKEAGVVKAEEVKETHSAKENEKPSSEV